MIFMIRHKFYMRVTAVTLDNGMDVCVYIASTKSSLLMMKVVSQVLKVKLCGTDIGRVK